MAKKAQNKKGDDKEIQALRVEHEKSLEKLAQDRQKAQSKKKRKSAPRRKTVEVLCAFCNGTGKDPFGGNVQTGYLPGVWRDGAGKAPSAHGSLCLLPGHGSI